MKAAVLLAGGSGTRMGTRPKCLLELDGVPLILRQLKALADAGIERIVVVTGHHAERIEPLLHGLAVTQVRNPRPDDGQTSSQRLGLAALSGPFDAVLVALADQPLIDASDIRALLEAWAQRPPGTAVVYPRVRGERGNPVIFGPAVREAILDGGPEFGCRQWQAVHPEAVMPFPTDNRHYRVDLDTPEDLAQFTRETGRLLRWPEGSA